MKFLIHQQETAVGTGSEEGPSIRTASHQSGLRYGKKRSTHIAGDSHNYAKGATRMKRRELAKAILEEIDRTRTQLARLRKVVMMRVSPMKTKGKE